MLSEISQTEKRQILYDLTYMWNLKQTKRQKNKDTKLIDTGNRLVFARGRGWGVGWMKQMKVVKRHKLPVIKQRSHADITCSMMTIGNTVLYI